ncbi:hypothetical protein LA59_17615 [Vibrio harveyi]|uniref:hypothetical protein n=1 Tax=Vibrio TaxID=662 RepID=UPI0005395969|nr:hypothetical protein [Vibrio harveyi]AIV07278.1 hypothetical protein LA59_17615 [Vibrio harveyi]
MKTKLITIVALIATSFTANASIIEEVGTPSFNYGEKQKIESRYPYLIGEMKSSLNRISFCYFTNLLVDNKEYTKKYQQWYELVAVDFVGMSKTDADNYALFNARMIMGLDENDRNGGKATIKSQMQNYLSEMNSCNQMLDEASK